MSIEYIKVAMVRPTLDNLPHYELPPTYSLRWYQPGDETAWLAIHRAADPFHDFTPTTFAAQFGNDPTVLVARQMYLCGADGAALGTATAWCKADPTGPAWGLIHWVAIHPTWQGKGLAKPLLADVCAQLHTLGYQRAYLSTATVRLPAINLYLQFGFVPTIHEDTATTLRAWQLVYQTLPHPAIAQFLQTHS